MARKALLYGCFAAFLMALPLAAQQDDGGTGSAPSEAPEGSGGSGATQEAVAAAPAPAASPAPGGAHPRVTGVSPLRASLGDAITIKVRELGALLSPNSQVRCRDLVLFLNEIAIPGSPPESCDPIDGDVRFLLDRTDKSDRAWHILLEEPISLEKRISVSIGPNPEIFYPTEVRPEAQDENKNFELEILPRPELFGFLATLAVGLALFIRLVRRTAILRDPVPAPEGKQPPYSLSRFQLAFWTLLVIAAYVFIWMITEELDTITGSILVLLGIGSGTALGAALIDAGKQEPAGSTAKAADAAPPARPRASEGFLTDLVSDDNGVSLYRFQLFVWTLVLGVIFCSSVYNGLTMPQFSTTLLGLMGLSSGTYLGFKVPESKTPPADGGDKS